MNKKSVPEIKPYSSKQYDLKQSKYEYAGKLSTRTLIVAPTGSGKTTLIQNLILDIYRNCFEKIYIFSPSIFIDDAFKSIMEYCKNELDQNEDDENKYFYDEYDVEALENILETQKQVVKYCKDNNMKKMFQIAVFIDDMADDPRVMRYSKTLDSLYTRGRHVYCSVFISVQKYRVLSNIIRVNATDLYLFALRNMSDYNAIIEEISAIEDKETIENIYKMTMETDPYAFLYVKLSSRSKNDMFYITLKHRILLNKK
jgi:hypothetical protein